MAGHGVAELPHTAAVVGGRGRMSPFRKDICVNGHDLTVTRRRYGKAQAALCRTCAQESQKKSRQKNPKKYSVLSLGYKRKREYGISPTAYIDMIEAQGGACAICKNANRNPKDKRSLAIDHDHATGQVRGLLCSNCNTALGLAGDSKETLLAMLAYLDRS